MVKETLGLKSHIQFVMDLMARSREGGRWQAGAKNFALFDAKKKLARGTPLRPTARSRLQQSTGSENAAPAHSVDSDGCDGPAEDHLRWLRGQLLRLSETPNETGLNRHRRRQSAGPVLFDSTRPG